MVDAQVHAVCNAAHLRRDADRGGLGDPAGAGHGYGGGRGRVSARVTSRGRGLCVLARFAFRGLRDPGVGVSARIFRS